jgi:hypothetical protein
VKIVRTTLAIDLRNVAIDGFDMYLLSRLDEPMTLDQLLEVCPCDATKAMQRVAHLSELGLLELRGSVALAAERARSEPPEDTMPTLRPVPLARTKLVAAQRGVCFRDVGRPGFPPVSEEAVTLRPPPIREVQSLRASPGREVPSLRAPSLPREPSLRSPPIREVSAFGEEPGTGVRTRPSAFVLERTKQRVR